MLLATIFLTASADAVSIHRILPAAPAAAEDSGSLTSRPSRSLEEFSGVAQKQATIFNILKSVMISSYLKFPRQTSSLEPFLRFARTTSSEDGAEAGNLSYEELMEQERRLDLLCSTVIEALR